MELNLYFEKLRRAVDRCETDPKYIGLDLIYQLGCQALLKLMRIKQLKDSIPDIWSYRTVLYVGARTGRIDFGRQFRRNGYEIDILDIFEPNVAFLRTIPWTNEVIHGDVREVDDIIDTTYDVVFWWHGPEHIERYELESTLLKLENVASNLVVCACPWGIFEQGNFMGILIKDIYPVCVQEILKR